MGNHPTLKLASYPRSILIFIFVNVFTLFCSLLTLFVIAPFMPRKTCDAFIRFWGKTLCRVSFVKVKLKGKGNLKGVSSGILVSNHLSLLDIPVLYTVLPLSFRMAAKEELFKIPFFGKAMAAFGFIPVLRENPETSARHFQKIQDRFEKGEFFWMAPEGTRCDGKKIGPFKQGAFFLALSAQQPIIPICIYGTQLALPRNSLLMNWGEWSREVVVEILPPVFAEESGVRARKELRDKVREQIVHAYSQYANYKSAH